MIMLFLSGMVAMIMLRTLHRDITKYNELASAEELCVYPALVIAISQEVSEYGFVYGSKL